MGDPSRDPAARALELTIGSPGRADAAIAAACPELTRARIQRLIERGAVTHNGATLRKSQRLEAGERVVVHIAAHQPAEPPPVPALPVLFEDVQLVAIDKPPGLTVHGGPRETGPTVAGWFSSRYTELSAAFDSPRPGIVHRLDRDTSGVLLLAKTPPAQAALARAFEQRTTVKTYLAVCRGAPPQARALIDAPIGRHPGDRTRMAVVTRGRKSRTAYEVLAQGDGRCFLRVRPESGRTHQIRVHLAAVGAPVEGDATYGRAGAGRQLLHAWQLEVPHPAGGRLTLTAPIPPDLAAAVAAFTPPAVALPYTRPLPATLSRETT